MQLLTSCWGKGKEPTRSETRGWTSKRWEVIWKRESQKSTSCCELLPPPHLYGAYSLPKKLAKGSWPPKNSLNTSSGLRNVKVKPGKSDEKSELEDPGNFSHWGQVGWREKGSRWKSTLLRVNVGGEREKVSQRSKGKRSDRKKRKTNGEKMKSWHTIKCFWFKSLLFTDFLSLVLVYGRHRSLCSSFYLPVWCILSFPYLSYASRLLSVVEEQNEFNDGLKQDKIHMSILSHQHPAEDHSIKSILMNDKWLIASVQVNCQSSRRLTVQT